MQTNKIKGLHIRSFNYITILIACILHAVLLYETINISIKYQSLIETTQDYISCEKDAALLSESSDYLTEQVRLYAINTDLSYMNDYFTEINSEKRRDQALDDLQKYHSNDSIYEALQKALECSNALTETEIYSMRLVSTACGYDEKNLPMEVREVSLDAEDLLLTSDEMLSKARAMVFDSSYQDAKAEIQAYVSQATVPILTDTQEKQFSSSEELAAAIRQDRICLIVLLIANMITFSVITLLVVKPLYLYIKCIQGNKPLNVSGAYEFQYLAATYNDIYDRNAANEAVLKQRAERDALTGILNRGAFNQISGLMENNDSSMALLLIDIDQFKTINDTYGHETGDHILQEVARLLTKTFRVSDNIARFGGDEFTVIMNGMTVAQKHIIHQKADYMNAQLALPNPDLPSVSLSIGVAFSANGYSQELFNHADQALYQVKEHGRCGCVFYDDIDVNTL